MYTKVKLILLALIAAPAITMAQSTQPVTTSQDQTKGPEAKNKAIHERKGEGEVVYTNKSEQISSPEYKNKKNPATEQAGKRKATVTRDEKRLTGPKAKNKEPWE